MIGKIIGAYAGDRLAKKTSSIGGASGAALGVVAAAALRRLSLPAMIALGVGGYIAKKVIDKETGKSADTTVKAGDVETSTSSVAA